MSIGYLQLLRQSLLPQNSADACRPAFESSWVPSLYECHPSRSEARRFLDGYGKTWKPGACHGFGPCHREPDVQIKTNPTGNRSEERMKMRSKRNWLTEYCVSSGQQSSESVCWPILVFGLDCRESGKSMHQGMGSMWSSRAATSFTERSTAVSWPCEQENARSNRIWVESEFGLNGRSETMKQVQNLRA